MYVKIYNLILFQYVTLTYNIIHQNIDQYISLEMHHELPPCSTYILFQCIRKFLLLFSKENFNPIL
jgi:hypothetical protein